MIEVLSSVLLFSASGVMGWTVIQIFDHDKRISKLELKEKLAEHKAR